MIWSRSRAARSNSSSSLASCICLSSRSSIGGGVAVEEVDELGDEGRVVVGGDRRRRRARRTSRCARRGTGGRAGRGGRTCSWCRCGSGTCAAGGRASRGSRRRGRTARSSARPCASAPRITMRPRPLLVEGDGEVGVGLVVLQADVEPGPVLLDQVELEEERLDLVADGDPLDRVGGARPSGGCVPRARSRSTTSPGCAGSSPCRRRGCGPRRP